MQPLPPGLPGDDPKTPCWHVHRNTQSTRRVCKVHYDIRTEAYTRYHASEISVITVRTNTERRNIFVDYTVFWKSFEFGIAANPFS